MVTFCKILFPNVTEDINLYHLVSGMDQDQLDKVVKSIKYDVDDRLLRFYDFCPKWDEVKCHAFSNLSELIIHSLLFIVLSQIHTNTYTRLKIMLST